MGGCPWHPPLKTHQVTCKLFGPISAKAWHANLVAIYNGSVAGGLLMGPAPGSLQSNSGTAEVAAAQSIDKLSTGRVASKDVNFKDCTAL
mgnify:FL=1